MHLSTRENLIYPTHKNKQYIKQIRVHYAPFGAQCCTMHLSAHGSTCQLAQGKLASGWNLFPQPIPLIKKKQMQQKKGGGSWIERWKENIRRRDILSTVLRILISLQAFFQPNKVFYEGEIIDESSLTLSMRRIERSISLVFMGGFKPSYKGQVLNCPFSPLLSSFIGLLIKCTSEPPFLTKQTSGITLPQTKVNHNYLSPLIAPFSIERLRKHFSRARILFIPFVEPAPLAKDAETGHRGARESLFLRPPHA